MRRTLVIALSVAVAGPGVGSARALAHGPCRCLDPILTQAGGTIRIGAEGLQAGVRGQPAYRVVFNPRPRDFGIAPGYLASAHRADVPTATVLSRSPRRPTREGRFRVPRHTPPGLYMVLIWDGEEGGGHNTWDYLHVTDAEQTDPFGVVARERSAESASVASPTPAANRESQANSPWPLLAGGGLGGLVLGFAAARAAPRRRRGT